MHEIVAGNYLLRLGGHQCVLGRMRLPIGSRDDLSLLISLVLLVITGSHQDSHYTGRVTESQVLPWLFALWCVDLISNSRDGLRMDPAVMASGMCR